MTALQQREQTFKKTPHKARLTALCGVFLVLRQYLAEQWQMTFSCFCVPRFPAADSDFPVKAIPHKDCATDASSNFSSEETKSGVNTGCIHEHFCEI